MVWKLILMKEMKDCLKKAFESYRFSLIVVLLYFIVESSYSFVSGVISHELNNAVSIRALVSTILTIAGSCLILCRKRSGLYILLICLVGDIAFDLIMRDVFVVWQMHLFITVFVALLFLFFLSLKKNGKSAWDILREA